VRGSFSSGTPSTEELLSALADHSLLRRYTDHGGRRVSLLQSIHEFARNRLALDPEQHEVRRRHAEYCLARAETLGPLLWGAGQVEAFRMLHAEALELRAALLWAAGPGGSTELALRLVGELWHYWELTGDVTEQQRIAVELVEATLDAAPQLRAPALSGAATLTWTLGRYNQAARLHRGALQAFEKSGNSPGVAWTILCLAVQAAQNGDFPTAERLTAEALSYPGASLRVRIGSLVVLSRQAYCAGDHPRALELSRACAELTRRLGDRWLLGVVLTNLAESTEQAGDYDGAELLLIEAISASLQLGAEGNLGAFLDSLGGVYASQERYDFALRLLAAADSYRTDRGMSLDQAERRRVDAIIDKARAEAGPIRFGLAWAAGRRLTVRQAANEVLQGGRQPRLANTFGGSARSDSPTAESAAGSAPWT
jgi:tetratricopeptide (TPR) repeat protein